MLSIVVPQDRDAIWGHAARIEGKVRVVEVPQPEEMFKGIKLGAQDSIKALFGAIVLKDDQAFVRICMKLTGCTAEAAMCLWTEWADMDVQAMQDRYERMIAYAALQKEIKQQRQEARYGVLA